MARARWRFGTTQHHSPQGPTKPDPPIIYSADEKKFGLENFGNTCYANSVIQALYFCSPFRDLMLQEIDRSNPQQYVGLPSQAVASSSHAPSTPTRRKPERKPSVSGDNAESTISLTTYIIPSAPPTLFSALRSLFAYVHSHPLEKGILAPRAFIEKLKESNELFRSSMHQDAHEFLMYLLNKIIEEVEKEKKHKRRSIDDLTTSSNSGKPSQDVTLVHKLFEGVLTSETRCLTCETVSSRDESFLDLSIDIEKNSSVTACLRQFSASEMLSQRNKFFCDSCCGLQEAEKRMKIKKLPNVLALHLKRFKYQEDVQKYIKLTYRIAFPFELRLFNTVDDVEDADRLYNLYAIVVHIGNGPHHGHFISIVKTLGQWSVFDDDNVYPIPEQDISKYFGDSNAGAAYLLYYQAVDIDPVALGLQMQSLPLSVVEPTDILLTADCAPSRPTSPVQDMPAMPPGLSTDTPNDLANGAHMNNTLPHPDHPELAEEKPADDNNTSIAVQADVNITPSPHPTQLDHSTARKPSMSSIFTGLRRPSSFSRPKTSNIESKRKIDIPDQPLPNNHHVGVGKSPPSSPRSAKRPATSAGPGFRSDDREREMQKDKTESKPGNWFRRRSFRGLDKSRSGTSIPKLNGQTHPALPSTKVQTGVPPESDHQEKQESFIVPPPINGRARVPRPHSSAGILNYARGLQRTTGHHNTSRHESSPPGNSVSYGSTSLSPSPLPPTSLASIRPSLSILPNPSFSTLPTSHRSLHAHSQSSDSSRTLEHKKSMPESNRNRRKEYSRPLPPVPPLPVVTSKSTTITPHTSATAPIVNGNAPEAAPRSSIRSTATTDSSSHAKQSATHNGHTPSFSFPLLGNEAKESLSAAASQIKRASRKLSFSAAFGFGRKDKEKHREKEKLR